MFPSHDRGGGGNMSTLSIGPGIGSSSSPPEPPSSVISSKISSTAIGPNGND